MVQANLKDLDLLGEVPQDSCLHYRECQWRVLMLAERFQQGKNSGLYGIVPAHRKALTVCICKSSSGKEEGRKKNCSSETLFLNFLRRLDVVGPGQ